MQIEIPDDLYNHLMKISHEMNTQDHRCTSMPYIFRILVTESKAVPEWCWDFHVWVHEWEEAFRDEHNSFLIEAQKYIESYFSEEDYEDVDFEDEDDVESFLDIKWFDKCDMEKLEDQRWFFLTHESAKRHWEMNRHHYPDEFQDYLDYCWRDPDMEAVQRFLCELSGGKIHK